MCKREKAILKETEAEMRNYVSPAVEIIEMEVEVGFALSIQGGNETYQEIQGTW